MTFSHKQLFSLTGLTWSALPRVPRVKVSMTLQELMKFEQLQSTSKKLLF